jgi:transcription initiation factor IIE alpha subunit
MKSLRGIGTAEGARKGLAACMRAYVREELTTEQLRALTYGFATLIAADRGLKERDLERQISELMDRLDRLEAERADRRGPVRTA